MERQGFDEKASEALIILFENFWILRAEDPEVYQTIREREHVLKRYVVDKFGFDLIVHQHFIKLEKIPVESRVWMGMQDFSEPIDYALFCCGLAFTESRSVDDQFLLSHICEEIKELYPGEMELDWTVYSHRKSLIRAMRKLVELGILKVVDGEIDEFHKDEEYEVLYEVTVYARYFMRNYPEQLFQYQTTDEILQSEWSRHSSDARRKRVYRKLFFSPVVYRKEKEDPDFAYIRNFRSRLSDDIEMHSPYRLEVFKNAAMLVMDERRQRLTLFPDQKGVTTVLLHLSAKLRENLESYEINELGEIRMTSMELEEWMKQVQKEAGHGFSKTFRQAPVSSLVSSVTEALENWELGYPEESGMFVIQPAFGRLIGHYPADYLEKRRVSDARENE
ncbi:TIGR02678 family protein [Halobacillus sp. BBL2006]|uniref:TIGR02678 family protein n=1 Tax=Halobacillus sp. BBL2006 TaxID=1543706 RepID=UPI000541C40F|nr:TIGR02678 family protein [Halobacillus sp. BBL2006]KHE69821.1 cytosolic protein [Halobacillus sp. BBL2006]